MKYQDDNYLEYQHQEVAILKIKRIKEALKEYSLVIKYHPKLRDVIISALQ